jgi:hypothetical protein
MFETGITDLLDLLLKRKPFEPFIVEVAGGQQISVTQDLQARVEDEAGLLYVRDWNRHHTTVIVLSQVVMVHAAREI